MDQGERDGREEMEGECMADDGKKRKPVSVTPACDLMNVISHEANVVRCRASLTPHSVLTSRSKESFDSRDKDSSLPRIPRKTRSLKLEFASLDHKRAIVLPLIAAYATRSAASLRGSPSDPFS